VNCIDAIEVTDALIVGTNVPENDHPEYDSNAVYMIGDRVILSALHTIYECLDDNVQGEAPDDLNQSPQRWFAVSKTNVRKAFDSKLKDRTEMPNLIRYVFRSATEIVRAIGFDGLNASEVYVRVEDNGQILYEETFNTTQISAGPGWYFYYFTRPRKMPQMVARGLPPTLNHDIIVEIREPSGTAAVGQIVLGNELEFGHTLEGSSVEGVDFSRNERLIYGDVDIRDRMITKRVRYNVKIPSASANYVTDRLTRLRTRPTFFYIGDDTEDLGVHLLGICDNPKITLSHSMSDLSLEVVGIAYPREF
jgi:hypothetical protein